MEFAVEPIDIGTRSPTVVVHADDAAELGAHPLDRVHLETPGGRTRTGIVEVTDSLVEPGTLAVTRPLGHLEGPLTVSLAGRPAAVEYVRKKLDDVELEDEELRAIVRDIDEDRLSDVELGAYVSGIYANGLSLAETKALTTAMADAGDRIEWDDRVVADKHSIGGVPGNRVTPIVIPIVAAAGVKIPKTSSRAVTSPAGTADTMAVLCKVEFDLAAVREIVDDVGGCLVWGGGVNLSPVDDKIIRAETPLSLDPPGQLIASVLSKKYSAGSSHVVIDIPYGEGAKVESLPAARELAQDVRRVGEHLGMHVECALTRGHQPIGAGIGPVLEARDVLEVLDGGGPRDLRLKSIQLADVLLECCDVDADAASILESGAADERFRAILAAQRGDPDVTPADLAPGRRTHEVHADREGLVAHIDNALVSDVARRAGAPKDAGAGIDLHVHVGEEIAVGDRLFTVHAEAEEKLEAARARVADTEPVRVRPPGEALVERH